MHHPLTPYIPVCDAVAALFAPHVEAVLHDLETGLIFHLANGFSRRRPGDSSLNEPGLADTLDGDVIGPYPKTNWNGHRLKAITAVIRAEDERPIGLLCLNHDIEMLEGVAQHLRSLTGFASTATGPEPLMAADWRESVNSVIGDFLAQRRVTLAALTGDERDDLLAELDERGVFTIRNATPYVADILKLSRATIYNRLGALRRRNKPGPDGDA